MYGAGCAFKLVFSALLLVPWITAAALGVKADGHPLTSVSVTMLFLG